MRTVCLLQAIVTAAALIAATMAYAQVTIGENTSLSLDGSLSVGYNGSYGNVVQSSHGFGFGGEADLKGNYYSPQFLAFQATAFYNESRLNSNFQSILNSTGVLASAQIFTGSRTPGWITFNKTYNQEGQFSLPGAADFKTSGQSQEFGVGWSLNFDGYPTVSASFSMGSGSYDVLGTNTPGGTDSKMFNVAAAYQLLGFNLHGSFTRSTIEQNLPAIPGITQELFTQTSQDGFSFSASRNISRSTNASVSYGRTHYSSDFSGGADQTFNIINASINSHPTERLSLSFNTAYTSNFFAYLLGAVVPGQPATLPLVLPSQQSSSLDLFGNVSYAFSNDLHASVTVNRRQQSYFRTSSESEGVTGNVSYTHKLLGGSFGAFGGVSRYTANVANSTSTGYNAGTSYSRRFHGWGTNTTFSYSRNVQSTLLSYTQSGFGYGVAVSRVMGPWRVNFNANGNHTSLDSMSVMQSSREGYGVGVSRRWISVGASYTRSSGYSLQTATGVIGLPPLPILPSAFLINYGGDGYSFSMGLNPARKMYFTADYSHGQYGTTNNGLVAINTQTQLNAKYEYFFRQLHFTAGFTRLTQAFSTIIGVPPTYNSYYVGVSRSFNFF